MNLLFGVTGVTQVPGGIARANLNVIHALSDLTQEREGSLTILSLLESDNDRPEFLDPTVAFRGLQGNKRAFAFDLFRSMRQADLVCFDHVSLSLPLLPFSATRQVRVVLFNHGSESWKRIQRLNRLSIRYATKCLTNSNYTLKKMREHLGEFAGAACPLGLPSDFPLNNALAHPNGNRLHLKAVDGSTRAIGKRMLLLVARMLPSERGKGHFQMLEAMTDLLKVYPDAQLVFAGDGEDREHLGSIATEKGIADAVFLPGFVPSELLKKLYEHSYAFVMPSVQEGFGLAYLEAMNHAKPCIGCFDQGAEDIVVNGETGILIHDQNDQFELVNAIRQLFDDPVRAQQLGRNGFARLHEQFTAAHHQARVKEEILKLL